ncbi:hypothetical protein ACIBQ0_09545 [Nocardia nova]|uniref:hypothetical protein n=1 Tax=Nocardia nova TaxID=37330 RepID=UPI0037A26899
MPGTTSGDDEEWAWLNNPPPPPESADHPGPGPDIDRAPEHPRPEVNWVGSFPAELPSGPDTPRARPGEIARRMPVRAWAGLAAVVAVLVGVVAAVHGDHPAAGTRPRGVTTSASVSAAEGACAGLSGTVVTDRGGDRASVAGVIATFEDAYYRLRSAEAAVQVIAPETGITQQSLEAGIATIPVGTTYCVAITTLTSNTANVHIVELHPDHKRVDYLQVINTIPAPPSGGGLLISHVQEQG